MRCAGTNVSLVRLLPAILAVVALLTLASVTAAAECAAVCQYARSLPDSRHRPTRRQANPRWSRRRQEPFAPQLIAMTLGRRMRNQLVAQSTNSRRIMTSRLAVSVGLMLWIGALTDRQQFSAQSPERSGPPVPYEDVGACPFEGCVYRDWVANDTITVRRDRRADAPIVFTLMKGERVKAMTGVVVTLKAGRVQFRKPVDLYSTSGALHIEPGQTLYLLTYHGEGSTTAWFQGRLYKGVDGSTAFFNAMCTDDCVGKILERPQSVWWAQIRNGNGEIGWTDQPRKFGNRDRFGAI
jgi:hypothetical protein